MPHIETHQLRKHYANNRKRNRERACKKFVQMRAAKERLRIERAMAEPTMPDLSNCEPMPKLKPSGFEVIVRCLDDGARASFRSVRTPFGLSISPTLAGKRVACVLRNYLPAWPMYSLRPHQVPHFQQLWAAIQHHGFCHDGSDTGTGRTFWPGSECESRRHQRPRKQTSDAAKAA